MPDRRETPRHDRDCIAELLSESIDKPAEQQKADCIRRLKRGVDQTELLIAPADLSVDKLLDQREDLAIDIIDGRGEEQQRANDPAHVSRRSTCRSKTHALPIEDRHLATVVFVSLLTRRVVSKRKLVAGGAVITS